MPLLTPKSPAVDRFYLIATAAILGGPGQLLLPLVYLDLSKECGGKAVSIILEWLDGLSPWWYAAGGTAILSITWMIYKCQHVPIIEKDEPRLKTLSPTETLLLEIDRLIAELAQLDIPRSKEDIFLLTAHLEALLQQLSSLRKHYSKNDSTKQ